MTSTSLQTSPSPSNYNYYHCLSQWCTQTHTHTPAFSLQNSKTPQVFVPPGSSEMCSIVPCVVSPLLPHPLALKDVCGNLLSSADEAAVMSEAQSPWGLWLMRITRGTPPPLFLAHPHTVSPSGLLNFTFSYSPVDSCSCTISAVMACMGLLLCKDEHGGGRAEKQQLQYGDEVQSMSHGVRESGAALRLWHSSRAAEPANTHSLLFQSRKSKTCQKHFEQVG